MSFHFNIIFCNSKVTLKIRIQILLEKKTIDTKKKKKIYMSE